LRRLLAPPPDTDGSPPLLTALRVAPGFEAAIGAAFGDELLAPLAGSKGAGAVRFWADLGGNQHDGAALPEGVRSLAEAVNAPAALARSLAQAGWVENEEAGRNLQPNLMPGQRLVDRDGRLWRWDGFVSIGSAPSPAAEQLRYGNRLAVLDSEIATSRTEALAAESAGAAGAGTRRGRADARPAVARLTQDAARRRERLASIGLEERAWHKRSTDAAAQQTALMERRSALQAEIAVLAARPATIAAESEA